MNIEKGFLKPDSVKELKKRKEVFMKIVEESKGLLFNEERGITYDMDFVDKMKKLLENKN